MKPEPSTRKTCRGAADAGAAAARASATSASFIKRASCGAGLPWRRLLAWPLGAGAVRARHHDARYQARRGGGVPIDEHPRTIWAFDLACGSQVQVHARVAERAAAAITGRDHLVDLDGFERCHVQSGTRGSAVDPALRTMIPVAVGQSNARI